ncbi:MAG: prolipoprotein diacylglyceryl transferase [Actinomycetota bacterium]|nr:prolipoprotein diacylglyceryl transferase [Actinomycetota bacterium]
MLGAPVKLGADPLAWTILPRIEIGPIAVSPHGIGIAFGVLLGARLGVYVARRYGGPDEAHIWNGLFWAMLGAIAGARIGYVLGHVSGVTDGGSDPLGVLKVWEGGISLLGGITGAVLASIPYMRRHGIPFWGAMDVVAPGLALGIGIGRIGDLVIGDHLGRQTSSPLGWRCLGEAGGRPPIDAAGYRAAVANGGAPSLGCFDVTVHQTALYDLLSTLLLLGLLLWLAGRRRRGGLLALVFVIWYGAARMVTDFLRVDRRYLGLTGSQILALTVGLICLYLLVRYRGAPRRWASGGHEPGSTVGYHRPGPPCA